jgi:drug/metabolite transporter (DMT)-like permease
MIASTALVSAESILALTPVVIKKTPVDATFAVWSRILSSAALGYLLSSDRGIAPEEFGGSVALGFTNLVHISSSYESFRHLPAGQAMSLLYTYPLWNLVLMGLFGGEHIPVRNYLFMGLATVGSFLLNMDPGIAAPTACGPGRLQVTTPAAWLHAQPAPLAETKPTDGGRLSVRTMPAESLGSPSPQLA